MGNMVSFITFCRNKPFLPQYIALFLVGLMWDSRGTHFLRGTHFSMTRVCQLTSITVPVHSDTGSSIHTGIRLNV